MTSILVFATQIFSDLCIKFFLRIKNDKSEVNLLKNGEEYVVTIRKKKTQKENGIHKADSLWSLHWRTG